MNVVFTGALIPGRVTGRAAAQDEETTKGYVGTANLVAESDHLRVSVARLSYREPEINNDRSGGYSTLITIFPGAVDNTAMALIDSIVVFIVSLLIGALGIYVGARIVSDYEDFGYAIVTALIGAIIWAVVSFFFGWIPLLGPLLVFLAYVTVINLRYPGGWVDAIAISLIAWIASLLVLYVLGALGFASLDAVGVPGV